MIESELGPPSPLLPRAKAVAAAPLPGLGDRATARRLRHAYWRSALGEAALVLGPVCARPWSRHGGSASEANRQLAHLVGTCV